MGNLLFGYRATVIMETALRRTPTIYLRLIERRCHNSHDVDDTENNL